MVTDDEWRREVAERLRMVSRPSLMILMHVLGVGEDGIFDRLADLIEPSCDRAALMELADEMEFDGARALDDGDWCTPLLDEYASRIREACGEVAP